MPAAELPQEEPKQRDMDELESMHRVCKGPYTYLWPRAPTTTGLGQNTLLSPLQVGQGRSKSCSCKQRRCNGAVCAGGSCKLL